MDASEPLRPDGRRVVLAFFPSAKFLGLKAVERPEIPAGLQSRLEEKANSVYNTASCPGTRGAQPCMSLPEPKPRRFTVISSGLLCGALAIVVIYTRRSAFSSPRALVVLAAIGSAAVLLQLRARNREHAKMVHPPTWLNILGIVLALIALFADRLGLNFEVVQFVSLAAVGSFAVSSAVILHAFRKDKAGEVSK
jgi:hypothetical protein